MFMCGLMFIGFDVYVWFDVYMWFDVRVWFDVHVLFSAATGLPLLHRAGAECVLVTTTTATRHLLLL